MSADAQIEARRRRCSRAIERTLAQLMRQVEQRKIRGAHRDHLRRQISASIQRAYHNLTLPMRTLEQTVDDADLQALNEGFCDAMLSFSATVIEAYRYRKTSAE